GIINSILHALTVMNIHEPHPEELELFIGPPLRTSFATRYNLPTEEATKAVEAYREYFGVRGLFENEVYAGIPEALQYFHQNGYTLFTATSKPTVYAKKILEYFALDQYFTDVIGSNLDNTRTDKTEVIAYAMHQHSILPERAVMIGDRKHDIIGGKNNTMRTIGVSYGYGSMEELTEEQPTYIVHSPKELTGLLTMFNL
ncbi:MAG: HAD hydrolase-like protein, partial [Candidatus Kapabacteria bacterium]|nr:HAD hydrolase-like protein [Candidatus Kapabacteria bacterium]